MYISKKEQKILDRVVDYISLWDVFRIDPDVPHRALEIAALRFCMLAGYETKPQTEVLLKKLIYAYPDLSNRVLVFTKIPDHLQKIVEQFNFCYRRTRWYHRNTRVIMLSLNQDVKIVTSVLMDDLRQLLSMNEEVCSNCNVACYDGSKCHFCGRRGA